MFRKIHIENFKSLADVTTDLAPFTVLVGDNGSGKSSFLQAIELMSWAVRYASINDALAAHAIDFRDLVYLRSRESQITLHAELDIKEPAENIDEFVHVEMRFKKRRYVYLDYEIVEPVSNMDSDSLHEAYGVRATARKREAWDRGRKGRHSIAHENVALGHSVLRDVARVTATRESFPVLSRVAAHFQNYVHYEIWGPEHLRQHSAGIPRRSASGNGQLIGKRGEGLPAVLRAIRSNQPEQWEELLKELRGTFPLIREIQFKRGLEANEFGIIFLEKPASTPTLLSYRPAQMSDGFMRLLGLLAIKYQPMPLALLGYEEPENGLHPSALHDCMRHLKEIAARGTQVIVTTHSPYLLTHLLEDQSEPVAQLCLVLRGKDGKTRIVPPDPEKIQLARRQGFGVGELWGTLLNEEELAQR